MTVERAVRAMAGTINLTGLALSLIDQRFLLISVFVGLNLLQSAFTGFCPAEMIFRKLGLRNSAS